MNSPDNSYNFFHRMEIDTWFDIEKEDLIDIYQVEKDHKSGVDMNKLK